LKKFSYPGELEVYAIDAQKRCRSKRRHGTWSVASAALGRTMIGAILLGATLKGKEKMNCKN